MLFKKTFSKIINSFLLIVFLVFSCVPNFVSAQNINSLPPAGQMVGLSDPFSPMLLRGVEVHPEDPLLFDFIVHHPDGDFSSNEAQQDLMKLVKYFLTGLTIKEDEIWVNLSPSEQHRIMNESLSQTDLGKELLLQDYILKQVMSTLLYPENDLGRQFWSEVYQKVYQEFGHTQIEVDSFNKVWIMPETATVVQNNNRVMIKEATLNVLLESDYLSMKEEGILTEDDSSLSTIKEITRSIILPILKKEINEGRNFASLRQMYHSLILSGWYKNNLQSVLLNQVYADTHKVEGISIDEKQIREQVYQQYLEAYQKGVFNYVKEETDIATNQVLPRKYFSGGITDLSVNPKTELGELPITDGAQKVSVKMKPLTGEEDSSQSIEIGIERTLYKLDPVDWNPDAKKNRPVRFGTSGDRGQFAKDFTFNHKKRIARGIALYLQSQYKGKTVYIGYDPRQDNKESAIDTARILSAYGMKVRIILDEPVSVAVLAYLINQTPNNAGGVMLTASHSPKTDGGIKVLAIDGGSPGEDITNQITAYANDGDDIYMADYEKAKSAGMIEEISPEQVMEQYVDQYLMPRLESAGALNDIVKYVKDKPEFKLILDPMQGGSARYLQALYDAIGKRAGRSFTEMINMDNNDPTFSLVNGEPNPTKETSRTGLVKRVLEGNGHWLGAATDADADRFGNIDSNGEPIMASDMIAMIAYFLSKEQGMQGRIGKSIVTSNFVNHVADFLNVELDEFPVGFKYAAALVREGKEYLVSGEESCHVLVGFLKESWDDGIAIGLMGLWITAKTGMTLTEYKDHIQKQLGKKFFTQTETLRGEDDSYKKPGKDLIEKTKQEIAINTPMNQLSIVTQMEELINQKTVSLTTLDGIKMVFENGSWVSLRLSGTEPAIKIAVEVAGQYTDDIEDMKAEREKIFQAMKTVGNIPDPIDASMTSNTSDEEYDELVDAKLIRHGGIDLALSHILDMEVQDFQQQNYQLDSEQIMVLRENLTGFVPVFVGEAPLELIVK